MSGQLEPAKLTKAYAVAITFSVDSNNPDKPSQILESKSVKDLVQKYKKAGKELSISQYQYEQEQSASIIFTVENEEEAKALATALTAIDSSATVNYSLLGVELPPSSQGSESGRQLSDADVRYAAEANLFVHTGGTWMQEIIGDQTGVTVLINSGLRVDHDMLNVHPSPITLYNCVSGVCRATKVDASKSQPERKHFNDDAFGAGTAAMGNILRFAPNEEIISFNMFVDKPITSFAAIEAAIDQIYLEMRRRKASGDNRKVVLNWNASWYGKLAPEGFNRRIQDKIDKLNAEFSDRFCVVVGAGTQGADVDKTPIYPAAFKGVLTIGTVEEDLFPPGFTPEKDLLGEDPNTGRDVLAAVGVYVRSPAHFGSTGEDKFSSGPTISSAAVSGMIANLWKLMPGLSGIEIQKLVHALAIDPNKTKFFDINQPLRIVNLEIHRVLKYIKDNELQEKCAPGVFAKMEQLAETHQLENLPVIGTSEPNFLMHNANPQRFNVGDTVSYQITVAPCIAGQELQIGATSQEMIGVSGLDHLDRLFASTLREPISGQIMLPLFTMHLPASNSDQTYTVSITREKDRSFALDEIATIKVFDQNGNDITKSVLDEPEQRLKGGHKMEGQIIERGPISNLNLLIKRSPEAELTGFAAVPQMQTPAGTMAPSMRSPTARPTSRRKPKPGKGRRTTAPTGTTTQSPSVAATTGVPTPALTTAPSVRPTTSRPTTAPTPDVFAAPVTLKHGDCGLFVITDRVRIQAHVANTSKNKKLEFKVGDYQFIITSDNDKHYTIKCLENGTIKQEKVFSLAGGISDLEAIKISNNNNELKIGIFKKMQAVAETVLDNIPNQSAATFAVALPKTYGARQVGVDECREAIRGLQAVDDSATGNQIPIPGRDRLPGHGTTGALPGASTHDNDWHPQPSAAMLGGAAMVLFTAAAAWLYRDQTAKTIAASRARSARTVEDDPEQPQSLLVVSNEGGIDELMREASSTYAPHLGR